MELLTSCPLDCPDRCSILCRSVDGELRLRGEPKHPYTLGFTCSKIRRYPGRRLSPHRIREPWIRRGDGYRPLSWDAALDLICEALDRARAENPASVMLVRGAGSMGMSKTFADYVFGSLGARGTRGSLCDAAGIAAIEADAGALRMNDPRQIDRAEAIVLWGKSPLDSSIHTAVQVARASRRGVPVVAVNPDPQSVRRLANRVVRVRPGADRFLALAVAKIYLENSDRTVPWDQAANAPAFEALLGRYGLADLLDLCGVESEEARALASFYLRTPRVATIVGWGLQRYANGGENVRAIHALAFVAGTLGIDGGGLYFNVPSSRHLRRPGLVPKGPNSLALPDLARQLPKAHPAIRVAWISCSNVLNQGPDAKANRDSFSSVSTVIVVDAFWTETARCATVVLPPALWLEEEDLAASYWHPAIGAIRKVFPPPGECRSDFEILRSLAARLGVDHPFPTVDHWLRALLPDQGPSLEEIRKQGWALCEEAPVAWEEGFSHVDGKFRFLEGLSPESPTDLRHPLRFLTHIRREALNSQLLPEEQQDALVVRLNPETAAFAGLRPGDGVRVVSISGELEGVVGMDPLLHPETVACPRGGWISLGQGVNEVTAAAVTDIGTGAAFYETRVRLERLTRT